MNMKPILSRIPAAALAILMLAGCQSAQVQNPFKKKDVPVEYKPANTFGVGFLPQSIGRVAVLPVHHDPATGADPAIISSVVVAELNNKGVLEAVPVSPVDLQRLSGRKSWDSTEPLPPELYAKLRSTYGADAVMMVDITSFYPYKPMSIGLRSKLAEISSGRVMWAADTIYNAGRDDIQEAALDFQKRKSGTPFPLEDSGSVLQSPRYFTRFAASTMLDTLPGR
jgi:hypothetical protein